MKYLKKAPYLIASLFICNTALAIDAPRVVSVEKTLIWSSVDGADSYNIHASNGDYIETLGPNANVWTVPASGNYFVVAVDGDDWRDWGRSSVVFVNAESLVDPNGAVTNARAEVYSTTALELFWDNAPEGSINVLRDDQLLGTTNGRSWFDNELTPNTTYKYTLDRFSLAGVRVGTTDISVTTNSDANSVINPVASTDIDETAIPQTPRNLDFAVYSSTAVELFWEHAEDLNENNVAYFVYQDGEVIAEWLDASSLYIDNLQPGTAYQFEVSAVANALNESEPTSVNLVTNGTPSNVLTNNGTINANNYLQIAADAVAVINMGAANDLAANMTALNSELSQAATDAASGNATPENLMFLSQITLDDDAGSPRIETAFGCASEGLVTFNERDFNGGPFADRTSDFSDCQLDDTQYTGAFTSRSGRRSDTFAQFNELETTAGEQVTRITGERNWTYPFFSTSDTVRWSNVNFDFDSGAGVTQATSLNIFREGFDRSDIPPTRYPVTDLEGQARSVVERNYRSLLDAQFNMATPATDQQFVSVSANLSFESNYWVWVSDFSLTPSAPAYPVYDLGSPLLSIGVNDEVDINQMAFNENAQWQTGQLVITADDGTSLTLRPNDQGQVTIELGDNEASTITPWNDEYSIHCSSIILGCGDNARPRFRSPRLGSDRLAD